MKEQLAKIRAEALSAFESAVDAAGEALGGVEKNE